MKKWKTIWKIKRRKIKRHIAEKLKEYKYKKAKKQLYLVELCTHVSIEKNLNIRREDIEEKLCAELAKKIMPYLEVKDIVWIPQTKTERIYAAVKFAVQIDGNIYEKKK